MNAMNPFFRRRRLLGAIVLVLLLTGGGFGIYALFRVRAYEQKVAATRFSGISPTVVKDGVYHGEYDADLIAARAEVTVQNGKLTRIRLLDYRHGRGETALAILDEMVRRQRLDVDVIAGATNSCIVIRKAAELALESARSRDG
ncbi:MAG: FMN-binding protein [Planctomycetota bacterium]|nr:FMN-binding protein [Planctomycetota bacterium]